MPAPGGFASLSQSPSVTGSFPRGFGGMAGSGGPGVPGAGQGTVGTAARQARYAMDTLGVPSFADIMKQFGGGSSSREFGNAGVAGAGADFARHELEGWKGGLEGIQKQIRDRQASGLGSNSFGRSLREDRADYANPTQNAGYQAEMGLARERTGAASAEAARQSAEASQRRGYAGGYDPRSADLARMQALSEAGFGAIKDVRDQALAKYGSDVGGYGAEQAQRQSRYNTDIGALTSQYGAGMEGYKGGLGAFTDLTRTQAELPTKWLSAMSPLLGGSMGGPSSFFHDALAATEGDRSYYQALKDRQRQQPPRQGYEGGVG